MSDASEIKNYGIFYSLFIYLFFFTGNCKVTKTNKYFRLQPHASNIHLKKNLITSQDIKILHLKEH